MGGRPGKPKLEDDVWIALLERYVAGETQEALAIQHGVSVSAVAWQARNRGYRKMDRPEAVYRWRQAPPITAAPSAEAACGWEFDPDDLEGSEARALEKAAEAAREGRPLDFVRMTQSVKGVRRLKVGGAMHSPHPVAEGDLPPHKGEGEWADPELREMQRPPEGGWTTWLFLGGRGAGKTLAGAMWLSDQAEALGAGGRLALIGPTLHDVREVMIEGVSGILSLPRWRDPKWGGRRPGFEPSRRRLTFPNGATAYAFSAEDPDSLRGPQFSAAWADEWCAWKGGGETLALLRMGLRLEGARVGEGSRFEGLGTREEKGGAGGETAVPSNLYPSPSTLPSTLPPRLCITTTPRPTGALRRLRAEPGVAETHAGTRENAAHLSAGFVEGLERVYGGTRRAAQEIEGKVVEDAGALFTAEMMMAARRGEVGGARDEGREEDASAPHPSNLEPLPSAFDRVIVAVDPTATLGGDACGIVVAGRCGEVAWVLADRTVAGVSPDGWGRRVARAAEAYGAACVVAEVNQGGDMVKSVLKASGCSVRVREVRATRGKRVRAEPVAALYEQGRVRHAARMDQLEEELMALGGEEEGASDRADALVWAVTDLLIDRAKVSEGPRIRMFDLGPRRPTGISDRVW